MEIWGIVNLTPDSFYAASRAESERSILTQAESFLREGADMLDLGAESTRPLAEPVSPETEWSRLEAALNVLRNSFGDQIFDRLSIDTRKEEIMSRVLDRGVSVINDVSGGSEKIFRLLSGYSCRYVLMHSRGGSVNMAKPALYDDVVSEVKEFLSSRSQLARQCGLSTERIIWDPGIGFDKLPADNIRLIREARQFRDSVHKVLFGVSRKSVIGTLTDTTVPEERYEGTLIVQTYLALQGADILRVHDVKAAVQVRSVAEKLA